MEVTAGRSGIESSTSLHFTRVCMYMYVLYLHVRHSYLRMHTHHWSYKCVNKVSITYLGLVVTMVSILQWIFLPRL